MSFISVFDVIGPNMVGPSSSHTAGACAIAYLAQKMNNGVLKKVTFTLYGSFSKTYRGHGTDRALLGGIMGFSTDDIRIRDSFSIAAAKGIDFSFIPNDTNTDLHPNTVDIRMENEDGRVMSVRGESTGGGKVRIVRINQVQVDSSLFSRTSPVWRPTSPNAWEITMSTLLLCAFSGSQRGRRHTRLWSRTESFPTTSLPG